MTKWLRFRLLYGKMLSVLELNKAVKNYRCTNSQQLLKITEGETLQVIKNMVIVAYTYLCLSYYPNDKLNLSVTQ